MGVKLAEKAEIGIGAYAGDICLECGKVHVPNAETIAAFGEGEAILGGGGIPSAVFIDPRQYQAREELKAALKKAL